MVGGGGSALTLGLNPSGNGELQQPPHPPSSVQVCVSDQEVSQEDENSQGNAEACDQTHLAVGPEHHARKRKLRRLDVAQWTDKAVKVLINALRLLRISSGMYDDDLVDKETGRRPSRSNKQIWKSVASAMHVLGHNFDPVQCKTKFKGLKTEYHATVLILGFSGGSHAAVPDNWEDICHASEENRERARKFKFFEDMRGYFSGSCSMQSPKSLFGPDKAEEFMKILETVKRDLDLGRRGEGLLLLDKEKCPTAADKGLVVVTDCQATVGRSEGNFLKRNSAVRVPGRPPVPPTVWTPNHLTDESLHQEDTDVQELLVPCEDTGKRKDSVVKDVQLEEYRAKKLQLKSQQLQLAEKIYELQVSKAEQEEKIYQLQVRKAEQEERQLQLEENNYKLQVRKAEHEMQHSTRKLELESRQLDMEERRLKQQEEHFVSSQRMMDLQANSRTQNFPAAES